MTGKHHIVTNLASLGAIVGGFAYISNKGLVTNLSTRAILDQAAAWLQPSFNIPSIVFVVLCISLYLLGTCLPDIDTPNSLLGRFFYLPVGHRTWTHALWIPFGFFAASFVSNLFFWVGLGYVMHLFWDSLSYGGVCFFYPISRYTVYSGGAQIKKYHPIRLYRVDSFSETLFVIVIIAISMIAIVGGVMSCFATPAF